MKPEKDYTDNKPQDRDGQLTHVDSSGRAYMVDVGYKPDTERIAVARGEVAMKPETLTKVLENTFAKGDVLGVARIAGIQAAKETSRLIPLCHPIAINQVTVELKPVANRSVIEIEATIKTTGKTGAEMEALTAVAVSALTVYDMCKSVDKAMRLNSIRLVRKSGGKSGDLVLEKQI